ncbi:MAG: phosphoenolpyruvate--protein phosphotransferase [Devosiaceae bacterium]|nr:phosphoenolpyruvate--protein phosphotransferase [Devosiaceae bacterium]
MPLTSGSPRILLRQLRETLAEPLGSQERLDKIVDVIALNMGANVCSFYVLRDDSELELFATHGLKREAIHVTTLRLGEGLVGIIGADAKMRNLDDVTKHPSFAYRPETGEDRFNAFLGVPVLRAGQMLGVLVVQNSEKRIYSEDETEAMLTSATILAEMLSTSEFESLIKPGSDIDLRRARTIEGVGFSQGIAIGQVVLHDPRVVVTNFVADNIDFELERLNRALRSMRMSIDDILNRSDMQISSTHRDILESYRMFAHDRGWEKRIQEAIKGGLTAEAGVERVQNDTRARMLRQSDLYIRERLHDLDDLANRLLRTLTDNSASLGLVELPKNAIIISRSMGPAELLEYDKSKLVGVVLEEGAATSHVAIVARSLGLVAIGGADPAVSICENGDEIIVDGKVGVVHLRPNAEVKSVYIDKQKLSSERLAHYASLRDKPSITKDGIKITLLHNSGLLSDMKSLEETGAEGIGLFRTELQFMIASKLPRLSEQVELYKKAMDNAGDKPVVFRLLDIGGDKVVPYMRSALEENPAMGWRSLRLALDRPGLLRTQIRALLKAANGRELKILVPMVTETSEFCKTREVVKKELLRLGRMGGRVPSKIELGAMIEVPSLLFELDILLPQVDFISIGSNDLVQFLTATDRANPRVATNYDAIALPRLRAFELIVKAAKKYNMPVTMCGELASDPLEALALMAIGMTSLSMGAASIGPIKEMILSLELEPVKELIEQALKENTISMPIRELLTNYVQSQNLMVKE